MTTNGNSIWLLVRSLEIGGAERQLVELSKGLNDRGFRVVVATFYKRGALIGDLEAAGIRILDLKKKGRWDVFGFIRRARKFIRGDSPDFLYSFLGGANIAAAALRLFVPNTKLIWSIRASDMDLARYDWLHRATYLLECRLARTPDLIVSNSYAGRDFAIRHGFPRKRIAVIPNGIDTKRFRPDPALRRSQRNAWGVTPDTIVIGVLARLDPMKGHRIFVHAASQALERQRNLCFFCIGEGPEKNQLKALATELGLCDRIVFTGLADAPSALNALDIACSSSIFGEGFSNAVAEAMACGLPCVVTNVGDASRIVGGIGAVVPPDNAEALADALVNQAKGLPQHDRVATRQRIVNHFSVESMVNRTIARLTAVE